MTGHRLVYLDSALDDFDEIAEYLTDKVDLEFAREFTGRLQDRCVGLAGIDGLFGQSRSNLATGLRSTPHGSYIIFFRYAVGQLHIVKVLHAARDLEALFEVARY